MPQKDYVLPLPAHQGQMENLDFHLCWAVMRCYQSTKKEDKEARAENVLKDTTAETFSNLFSVPGGSDGKESACDLGDPGFMLGLGRSGEGNGSLLQYSCLENSVDRGYSPWGCRVRHA